MNNARRSLLRSLLAAPLLGLLAPWSIRAATATPHRIGVIGAGSLGGTVGRLWVAAGHEVMFSSRHPEELRVMTDPLGTAAKIGTPHEAATFGEVLLFAVPYDALPALGQDLRSVIRGKIVLDACNPNWVNLSSVGREAEENGTGPTSAKYLPGTRLVRAFSAVDATVIAASATRQSDRVAVPIAGDDNEAVQIASRLVQEAGCDPLVVGNLAHARAFQRGSPGFRANANLPTLRHLLGIEKGA